MSGFELKRYQVEAVDRVLKRWGDGKSCLIAMATGTGKTEVFLSALDREREVGNLSRALVVAHRVELLEQPYERIAGHFPVLGDAGIVQAGRDEYDRQVVIASIATVRSLERLSRILDAGPVSHLVIDEAHHSLAQTYREMVRRVREKNPV